MSDRTERPDVVPGAADLSPLQRAIVLTLLYSDLFDYPLTHDELQRYLPAACPAPDEWDRALAPMIGRWVSQTDDWFAMVGREPIIEIRRERQSQSDHLWRWANRYAGWMVRVPFVRMVGVCGSLAAGNATADADVDLFLVTAPGRLWTVQVWAMLLRRIASLFGVRVCPNYFLTVDSLRVEPHTLYLAREVAQVVPLYGAETYARFLDSNSWTRQLLPNATGPEGQGRYGCSATPPSGTRFLEWLFAGRLGGLLDRVLFWMLLRYYPRRRAKEGWQRAHLLQAYRRDRQTVLGGGYGPAIERAFRDRVAAWFGRASQVPELDEWFPVPARKAPTSAGPEGEPGLFGQLFAERYGRDHD